MSSQVEDGRRMFQLRQSPLTGESEWIVVEEEMEEDDSKTTEALRWSLSATSYLDMLNDSYRNRAFRLAIERTVTVNCHVLDIGYFLSALRNFKSEWIGSRASMLVSEILDSELLGED
ncbi:hypothetical protein HPP92_008920 [Vanilla planifolia]|uniref:Uncharacterized protein n=1 Tax=Vanilla planifolia TaxID=51239 RepID=A0A835V6G5_VANPL|nr:hypothetical protein HPP92_008920 [Vanilla planifolia]